MCIESSDKREKEEWIRFDWSHQVVIYYDHRSNLWLYTCHSYKEIIINFEEGWSWKHLQCIRMVPNRPFCINSENQCCIVVLGATPERPHDWWAYPKIQFWRNWWQILVGCHEGLHRSRLLQTEERRSSNPGLSMHYSAPDFKDACVTCVKIRWLRLSSQTRATLW